VLFRSTEEIIKQLAAAKRGDVGCVTIRELHTELEMLFQQMIKVEFELMIGK
jgi:hypothetical protein